MRSDNPYRDALAKDPVAQKWSTMSDAERSPKWGQNGVPDHVTATPEVEEALDHCVVEDRPYPGSEQSP